MRRVAIVGFAPDTRALANAEPPDVELWGMNIGHEFLTRWDRWFQIHPFVWEGRPFYGRNREHLEWLARCGVPVYMTDPHESIKTAVAYPLNRVAESVGRDYLTSTAAYALALAITERVDEIKLYGVNSTTEIEYVEQRPCLEWLLGLAEGRFIKVTLPDAAVLLKGERYPGSRAGNSQAIQDRLNANRDAYVTTWAKAQELLGAYRALEVAGLADRAGGVRKQYVECVLRLQRDLGKYNEALLAMRRAGGTDTGVTKLPELDVPAKLMTAEDVTAAVSV